MSRERASRVAPFLCAALLGVASILGCYRPQRIAGPEPHWASERALGGTLIPRSGMRLHVFNTGVNRVSSLLVGSPAPWRPVPAFVIEHPDHGWIVFDCGLGPEVGRMGEKVLPLITRFLFKTRSRPGLDLASQMRSAGIEPEKVETVVFSHLHFDHVGSADAFTQATFVVGRGEREQATSRLKGFAPEHTDWIPSAAWREIDFEHAKPIASFEHAVDLFGDHSIWLVAGGGHTAGGMGALVALPEGPVLLAGDLVVHFDWLENDDVQRIVVDGPRAAQVRNQIRLLVKRIPGLVVFPGHDLSRVPRNREDIVLHRGSATLDRFSVDAWPRSTR